MDKVLLFTGIYDFFGIKLAKKFYDEGAHEIFCLCSENLMKSLKKHIDSLPEYNDRHELLDCIGNIKLLDYNIEGIDFNAAHLENIFKNKAVCLWHYNDEFSFNNSYSNEAVNFNNTILERIMQIVEKCNVAEINYISSIYPTGCSHNAKGFSSLSNTFEKVRVMSEEFFTDKLKLTNIKFKIYKTPILYEDFHESRYMLIDKFAERLFEFKNWVEQRIPNYFSENRLIVYTNKNESFNILPTDIIIDEIYENYSQEAASQTEVFYIANPQNITFEAILNEINSAAEHICIQITHDKGQMGDIDILFDKIICFHLPYIRSNIDEKVRKNAASEKMELYNRELFSALANRVRSLEKENRNNRPSMNQIKKTIHLEDGNELNYYVAGEGEAIIIVSAFGVEHPAWEDIISELSKEYRVIVWMIRGILNDEVPQNGEKLVFGITHQIRDIERIVENEKLDRFHFISWCSGVKSALIYAKKHKSVVQSQIILAGEFVPYKGSNKDQSKFRGNIGFITEMMNHNKRLLDFYARMIYEGTFRQPVSQFSKENESHIYEIVPERFRDILLNPFTSREKMINFLNMCMEYYEHDITEIIKHTDIPVLLLCAEYDMVAPSEQTYWADNLFMNSNLICFPSSTHLMFVERYKDIINSIRKHMKYIKAVRIREHEVYEDNKRYHSV